MKLNIYAADLIFFTKDFIKIEELYGGEVNIGMDAKKFLGNHQIFDDFFVTP